MDKRQVILIQAQPLLGEGLRRILARLEDIELISLKYPDLEHVDAHWENYHPDIVLIAGDKESEPADHLITRLLKLFENIPIGWVELETNIVRVYTSHSLTASSAGLIHAIRDNESGKVEIFPLERHHRPNS